MRVWFLLIFLTVPVVAMAEANQNGPIENANIEFQGVYFGDFPIEEMICIKGACPDGEIGEGVLPKDSLLSTYMRSTDITHLERVRISAPEYDYYQDHFLRVRFDVLCDVSTMSFCLDSVVEALDQKYGLSEISHRQTASSAEQLVESDVYRTDGGAMVIIANSHDAGGLMSTSVRVYDKDLMDELRSLTNPDYVPIALGN